MQVYDFMDIKKNKIGLTFLKYDVSIVLPGSFDTDFDVEVNYYKNSNSEPETRVYQVDTLEDAFIFAHNDIKHSKNLEELDVRYKLFYLEPEIRESKIKELKKKRRNKHVNRI